MVSYLFPGSPPVTMFCASEHQWEIDLFDESKTVLQCSYTRHTAYPHAPAFVEASRNGKYVLYHLKKLLGRGTHGSVYKYECEEYPRSFALKITGEDESLVTRHIRRFRPDGCNQIRLRKVHTHQQGGSSQTFYFAMPLMDGDLGQLLREFNLTRQVKFQVLEEIRQQVVCLLEITGIPYMDLKPENVMYRRLNSGELCVSVSDLGSLLQLKGQCPKTTFPPPWYGAACNAAKSRLDKQRLLSWAVGVMVVAFFYPRYLRNLYDIDQYNNPAELTRYIQYKLQTCFSIPEQVLQLLNAHRRPLISKITISDTAVNKR